MNPRIQFDRGKIAQLCRKHHVRSLAVFGSVLRDDFRPDSDVDVLVEFEPDARPSLFDLAEMSEELKEMVGRDVDLVEKAGLRNPFRKKSILDTAELVYAS
ncbi:nucleotidyltransferase family protein [candidate division WOR-3 bacterium]|uniref:Nucleotidyltransferase family protein n=1 Tax=candidate division WOR-3 bacterium TaxID=2052148 RepID=A0A937XCR8_UNCW3|nr:nucleotidyltransferase family protein [candidate division WOR-3 bacterium]